MFQRILVPLDGSAFSEIAIPVALDLAKRANGTVHLVHAYEPWTRVAPSPEGLVMSEEANVTLREIDAKYLADVVGRVAPAAPVPVTSELIDGFAGPALVDHLAQCRADLVVMTTHGRGPLSRLWLGSVADYLIRHGSTPILLLRPKDEVDWAPSGLRIERILATTDFSATADVVLEPVATVAKLCGSSIELTNVVQPLLGYPPSAFAFPVSAGPEVEELAETTAREELDKRAVMLRAQGLTVTTSVLFGSGVAGALLDRAQESGTNLVAIATHGHTGWRRAVLGSVADKLIRGAGGAVLVVPARTRAAEVRGPVQVTEAAAALSG
jgi:nucleotide-binding universal stress UspA family protein